MILLCGFFFNKADRHFVDSDVDSRVDERRRDPPCG